MQVKDVRVPENLQRAMAAEAEAARNARAKVVMLILTTRMRKRDTSLQKVIAAEGEHKASRALR